jgi:hypothetical protein
MMALSATQAERWQRENESDLRQRELILEIARQHQLTAWAVYQMARLVCFGEEAVDNPAYDPFDEVRGQHWRDEEQLKGQPTISELMEIWQRNRDLFAATAERQTGPTRRAAMLRALAKRDAEMRAIQERAKALLERRMS